MVALKLHCCNLIKQQNPLGGMENLLNMEIHDFLRPRKQNLTRHEFVVSRILRVHGSSGHEPESKNLQNKQGTGGGVSADSPMLKLVKKIESVLTISLIGVYFSRPFFLALPPLFMKKDDDPLFMGSG